MHLTPSPKYLLSLVKADLFATTWGILIPRKYLSLLHASDAINFELLKALLAPGDFRLKNKSTPHDGDGLQNYVLHSLLCKSPVLHLERLKLPENKTMRVNTPPCSRLEQASNRRCRGSQCRRGWRCSDDGKATILGAVELGKEQSLAKGYLVKFCSSRRSRRRS